MTSDQDVKKACEIYRIAKNAIGSDLCGSSLVDLLADNSDWSLEDCIRLAKQVCLNCVVSDRLRSKHLATGGGES